MSSTRKLAAVVFVGVFVAVVAVGGVVGFVLDGGSGDTAPDHTEIANPQYDADRVTSDGSPGTATVVMDSTASSSTVVLDAGGAVSERDVELLTNALVEAGHEVTMLRESGSSAFPGRPGPVAPPGGDPSPRLGNSLQDADGFISVGVSGYADQDLDAIGEFVDDGGHLVMAVDPGGEFTSSLTGTYSELGAYTEPGYVYNLAENDLNYQRIFAEPAGDGLLTEGVDRVVFDSATPVQAGSVDERLEPIEGSVLSVTRAETEKPVLVRDDNVALVGDTGFMTPENAQRADNDVFVGNVADFLVEGDRSRADNSDGTTGGGAGDSEATTVAVGPNGENVFEPEFVEIEPGTTVRFEWESDGHNLVPTFQQPENLGWEGVPEIRDAGFVHEYTFEEEGVHEFVSEPHEDDLMYGAVVVGDPAP